MALNSAYPAGVSARINMDMVTGLRERMFLSFGKDLQLQGELMAVVVCGRGGPCYAGINKRELCLAQKFFFTGKTDKGIVLRQRVGHVEESWRARLICDWEDETPG